MQQFWQSDTIDTLQRFPLFAYEARAAGMILSIFVHSLLLREPPARTEEIIVACDVSIMPSEPRSCSWMGVYLHHSFLLSLCLTGLTADSSTAQHARESDNIRQYETFISAVQASCASNAESCASSARRIARRQKVSQFTTWNSFVTTRYHPL